MGAPLQATVYCDDLLVSVTGSPVTSHGDSPHNSAVTGIGSPTVFIGTTFMVNGTLDVDSCGHTRVAGSPKAYINS